MEKHKDYLYILVRTADDIFKIGISSSLQGRLACLNLDGPFCEERSRLIKMPSGSMARAVERTLHFKFDQYNAKEHTASHGITEWFYIECLPQVLAEVEILTRNPDGTLFEVLPIPKAQLSDELTTRRGAPSGWRKENPRPARQAQRYTKAELDLIQKAAEARGQTASEYIRTVVVSSAKRVLSKQKEAA